MEGTTDEDPNSSWPFFTVLDAIASGKTVTITSPVGTSPTFQQGAASCSSSINTTINASVLQSPGNQVSTSFLKKSVYLV